MKKKITLEKVTSLGDLARRAASDPRYHALTMIAANNLGRKCKTVMEAASWLNTNAMETDETGVVREVNGVRDCVETDNLVIEIASLNPKTLERIRTAALTTWNYIASDTMAMEREMGNRSGRIKRAIVMELVMDANRMEMFDKEADAFARVIDIGELEKWLKREVFTVAYYE